MASGWTNNDRQGQERRNREWIGRYLAGLPLPDVDDAAVAQVLPRSFAFPVINVDTNNLTFQAGALVVVHRLWLINTSDVAQHGWLSLSNAAFSYADIVARSATIQPREPILFDGPWFCAGGATVRSGTVGGGTAGQLTGRIDYTLMRQPTPGLTAGYVHALLTTTPAVLYTAPAGVHSAYLASIGVCTHGAVDYANTPIVELLPVGQASAPQFYLANAPMPAAETELAGGYTMQPGDAIRAWRVGPAPDIVSIALNVIEFRG